MTTGAQIWRPTAAPGVRIGPAGWDGNSLVTEVAATDAGRVYRLGPLETMVLEAARQPGSPQEIRERIENAAGVPVRQESVGRILNTLVLHGLVERPFRVPTAQLESIDRAARARAEARPASLSSVSGPLASIATAAWAVARTPAAPLLGVLGVFFAGLTVTLIVPGWATIISAARAAADLPFPELVTVVIGVIAWHLISQLGHELSHGMAFVRLSRGRNPVLSVTSLGPIPLPATHFDGFGLLNERRRRLTVVLAGPLFTLALATIPASIALTGSGALATWGAISLLLDLTIVVLSLSPFPNTDMTRGIEAITETRQLPIAYSRYRRGASLPTALPARTQLTVRFYPVVVGVAMLLAGSWIGLLLRSLI